MSNPRQPGIYAIANTLNNKLYIGQTLDLATRARIHFHHLRHNRHRNAHLQAAFNKHGPTRFIYMILQQCCPADLDFTERELIKLHNTTDPEYGYNIEPGGIRNHPESPVTRLKIQRSLSRYHASYHDPAPDTPDCPDFS